MGSSVLGTTVRRGQTTNGSGGPPRLVIVWVFPDASVDATTLDRERIVIGRDPSCDVVLPDEQTSRQHAELRRNGLVVVARDLDSTNGVLLNGARITEAVLKTNDVLRIGDWIGVVAAFDRTMSLDVPLFRQITQGYWGGPTLRTICWRWACCPTTSTPRGAHDADVHRPTPLPAASTKLTYSTKAPMQSPPQPRSRTRATDARLGCRSGREPLGTCRCQGRGGASSGGSRGRREEEVRQGRRLLSWQTMSLWLRERSFAQDLTYTNEVILGDVAICRLTCVVQLGTLGLAAGEKVGGAGEQQGPKMSSTPLLPIVESRSSKLCPTAAAPPSARRSPRIGLTARPSFRTDWRSHD
jgi:hypothetical protein